MILMCASICIKTKFETDIITAFGVRKIKSLVFFHLYERSCYIIVSNIELFNCNILAILILNRRDNNVYFKIVWFIL